MRLHRSKINDSILNCFIWKQGFVFGYSRENGFPFHKLINFLLMFYSVSEKSVS